MAEIHLIVVFGKPGGAIVCVPPETEVKQGDQVQWQSPDGDIAVGFGANSPFVPSKLLTAKQNKLTDGATVRDDAPLNQPFTPTIELGRGKGNPLHGTIIVR
jgi:hypothetical protein